MSRNYGLLLCAIVLLALFQTVTASSAPPRPLKRVAHPSTLALEIFPRRPTFDQVYSKRSPSIDSPVLHHTDSFRLKLSAFGETYNLHLRPNEDLIHPAARINYYTTLPDGQSVITHTEPLLPGSVKAFWGDVVPAEISDDRMRQDTAGMVHKSPGLGWARITVHHQGDFEKGLPPSFEGAFSANGIVHHVTTKDNYLRNKHHLDPLIVLSDDDPDSGLVIFRDSDVMADHEYHTLVGTFSPARTCAHDNLKFNTDALVNPALRKPVPRPSTPWYDPLGFLDAHTRHPNETISKRDDVAGGGMGTNFVDHIGQNGGCPSSQKVVYMGVAADCVYTSRYGSAQNASQQILTNFNTASALYKSTFNVSLGIVELQVHDPTCPGAADPAVPWNVACRDDLTLNDRLSLFSQWRGQKGDDGAGLWHLMSGCPTGSEVGIAWLATLCQQTSSGTSGSIVSGTAVSTSGRVEWQVIAHEIGHNFGAIHDCTDGCTSSSQCCPLSRDTCNAGSQYIMSPVAESSEITFSPCSLGNICSLMLGNSGGKTNTACLVDPGTGSRNVISLQMCGNGIVEDGEDCDPGSGVTSACCDSATCKFRSGAVCDPSSSSCCTSQCSFAPSTLLCRPSKDASCDTPEYCTGNSSTCPTDIFAPNGQSCGSDGLACASGTCTSLDKQCQTVGASMGLTRSCPSRNDKSCQVSCQDPNVSNQCVVLQSALVDGSPCGYGGTCQRGNCQSGSFLDTAKSWYTQNLQIAIPVTVVVGIVIIMIIWALISAIKGCCTKRRRPIKRQTLEPAFRGQPGMRIPSWPNQANVVVVPQPAMSQAQRDAPPSYAYGPNVPQQGRRLSRHSRGQSDAPWVPISDASRHHPSRSAGSNSSFEGNGYKPQFPNPYDSTR